MTVTDEAEFLEKYILLDSIDFLSVFGKILGTLSIGRSCCKLETYPFLREHPDFAKIQFGSALTHYKNKFPHLGCSLFYHEMLSALHTKYFGLYRLPFSNKIRLCYDKMLGRNYRFCAFTGIVAHEFGHAVGIPKKRFGQHHKYRDDRVYKFGDFAENLCISQGRNRRLE